jgi:hypothetical protein
MEIEMPGTINDEQLVQRCRWHFQLHRGEKLGLIPWEEEPFELTHVFFVDPMSAAGEGVVESYVEMGTENIMLPQLSSEVTAVELEAPVVLHEDFCFYVMRPEGDSSAGTDEDALVVQFEGFVELPLEYSDTEDEDSEEYDSEEEDSEEHEEEEEEEEEEGEKDDEKEGEGKEKEKKEAAEDDDDNVDEDEESDGEVEQEVARLQLDS